MSGRVKVVGWMRTTNSLQAKDLLGRCSSQTVECRVVVVASTLKALLQQLVGDESAMMPQDCLVQLVLHSLVLRGPVCVTVACKQLQLPGVVETIAGHFQQLKQIRCSWPTASQPLVLWTRAKSRQGVLRPAGAEPLDSLRSVASQARSEALPLHIGQSP